MLTTRMPGFEGTEVTVHSSISTPSWYLDAPGMRSAIISLEFEDGFPVDGMPAVNMAADIWAQSLESVVPITILVKWIPRMCWPKQKCWKS